MEVRPVDPRGQRWEIDSPSYRVYFWTRPLAPPHVPQDIVMYHSTEFELSGVGDVGEVLEWAEANAPPESTHTIYAVIEHAGEEGLVRLRGADPTGANGPDLPTR
jgi:hypothetical protein